MAHIQPSSVPETLTNREREILAYLSDGLSNREIADKLYLAEKTVRWYNTQIFSKLGVTNRNEAVKRAEALGLLDSDTPNRSSHKDNLPAQATPFVGRQTELGEVTVLLNDANARLITILAPGGMGKTRLALEAARTQIGNYRDGVYFVSLAPLGSANDIVTAIAENIGFIFYGEKPLVQQLRDFLKDRDLLLVLDNFEHLLEGAPLVADFLQAAPNLRVLTTSRERLNLRGETIYVLRGLDFPTWETPEDALQYDAVKLFMQSAHRVRPDFEIHADNLDTLARICRLTAGMPLGVELAAGWVDVLTLEQIAAEIQRGIDILETEMRDVPERQRSIRATFESSWERLNVDEQRVFMRLSVFRGGFTVEAARVITGTDVRSLRKLTNKALVQATPNGRHDIHELLRQFGRDKLDEAGELRTIQAKHTAYFADFMQARQGEIYSHQQLDALDRIGGDFENIRSAWNVVVDQQAFGELPKFLEGLWFFLDVRNRGQEGVVLFETAANILQSLLTSDVTELALARLWARLPWFYNDVGLPEKGKIMAEAAIRLLERLDSPEDLLAAYRSRAIVSIFQKDAENERRMGEAGYKLARQLGNRSHEALSLLYLGGAASLFNEDIDVVLRPTRQARLIYEELGDQLGILLCAATEADSAFQVGDYEQAKYWSEQRQALANVFGQAFHMADSVLFLGVIALRQGNHNQSWNLLRQSLHILWDAGYTNFIRVPVFWMIHFLLHENKTERAVEILALLERYPANHPVFELGPDPVRKLSEALKTRLEPNRFAAAWKRGQERELSALVAELLAESGDE